MPATAALATEIVDETPVVETPNPISTEGSDAERLAEAEADAKALADERAMKARPKPTMREALERATKKVDAADDPDNSVKAAAEKEDAEIEAKAKGAERDDTGRFKAKPDTPEQAAEKAEAVAKQKADEAEVKAKGDGRPQADIKVPPSRFSADAKAAWETAPEPVRHEVHRAIRNLEDGIAQHTARWAPLKEFDDLARKSNTTLPAALKEYVNIDRLLGENFQAGVERIFQNKGINLRDFAAHIMGQPIDRQRSQADTTIANMTREIEALKRTVSGITTRSNNDSLAAIGRDIDAFAADKPLFEELAPDIVRHINESGLSLESAYDTALSEATDRARRLGLTAPPKAPAQSAVDDPEAQTLMRGRKSIKGAPSAGSSPAAPKPAPTVREALRRAAARAG